MIQQNHLQDLAASCRSLAAAACSLDARRELLALADAYERRARLRQRTLARVERIAAR